MDSSATGGKFELTNDKLVVYFAALIVLLIMVLMYVMKWHKNTSTVPSEHLNVGYPYAYGASSYNQGFAEYAQSGMSSGAYMRNLSQEMSQPIQGEYTSPSAIRVKGVEDFVWPEQTVGKITTPGVTALANEARRTSEPFKSNKLVSKRGEPDFWELPQELRTAQTAQIGLRTEKFAVGGNNTPASHDVDAYTYPWVY
jgi:hypothetical protein